MMIKITDYKHFWEYLNEETKRNKLEHVYIHLETKTYDTQYDFETLEHFTEEFLIVANNYRNIKNDCILFYKIIQAYPAYDRKRKIKLI